MMDSAPCDEHEFAQINENQARVVDTGRKPGLKIFAQSKEVPLIQQAKWMLEQIRSTATSLDNAHQSDSYTLAINQQMEKVDAPEQTPSGVLLNTLKDEGIKYTEYIHELSAKHMQHHIEHAPDQQRKTELKRQAEESNKKQQEIENGDSLPFHEFLTHYFTNN